jgi:hypothetical protein
MSRLSSVISHSPNLAALPKSLQDLSQLSKLTFSHCPRLTAATLPDLSTLPLLRDVKMNNLALLDKLPQHMAKWGTGPLAATDRDTTIRHGDGLQVLDLGNCSLPFSAIESTFLSQKWPHLRSLSLHSNPLVMTHPDFATLLQDSDTLPHLQIIDSKRIVQRKRKGEVQESKIERRRREKKEKKRITGANMKESSGVMRVWGTDQDTAAHAKQEEPLQMKADAVDDQPRSAKRKRPSKVASTAQTDERIKNPPKEDVTDTPKRIKRVKATSTDAKDQAGPSTEVTPSASSNTLETSVQAKTREKSKTAETTRVPQVHTSDTKSAEDAKARKRKSEGGKVETVATSRGGVDLKNVLAKPVDDFGAGGW